MLRVRTGWANAETIALSRDGQTVFMAGWIQPYDQPTQACTGFVQAFDAQSGRRIWRARQKSSELCWYPTDLTVGRRAAFVSSGTQFVGGAVGGQLDRLDPETGRRASVYATKKGSPSQGMSTLSTLEFSRDYRHLFVAGAFGIRTKGGPYDAVGWFVRRLSVDHAEMSTDWSFGRRFKVGTMNPLSQILVTRRNHVLIVGSELSPFRTFVIGLRSHDGRRVWRFRGPDNSLAIDHNVVAASSGRVVLTFQTWNRGIGIDERHEMVALDEDTGNEIWSDTFISFNQTTATSIDWKHYPLVLATPSASTVYQIVRGYGYIEVRALELSSGAQRWYSSYSEGLRSGASDGEIVPESGTMMLGAASVPEQGRPGKSMLFRFDP